MNRQVVHRPRLPLSATGLAAALVLSAVLVIGCSSDADNPTEPVVQDTPPEPTSAVNVASRVRWAFSRQDTAMTRGLYTRDYAFLLHPIDVGTFGDTDGLLNRAEELEFVRLFRTTPPVLASFRFTGAASESPDSRPGKDARFHRRVDVGVVVDVQDVAARYVISGTLAFFAVRGDSADIDDSIRGAASLPDSSRWYVDRIEDGTGGPIVASDARGESPQPARNFTLGAYKMTRLYLDDNPPPVGR